MTIAAAPPAMARVADSALLPAARCLRAVLTGCAAAGHAAVRRALSDRQNLGPADQAGAGRGQHAR
jgi:hypothetical protein